MRKYLILALSVGLFLGTMTVAQAYEHKDYSKWAKQECRFARNGAWSASEVRDVIRCAGDKVDNRKDIGEALHISGRESGYRENANNDHSTAGGIFQWLASSWPGHQYPALNRHWDLSNHLPEYDGSGDRFDPRTAAFVSLTHMKRHGCGAWIYQGQVLC